MKQIIYTPFLFLFIITGFTFAVPGCQDDTACNYNMNATEAGACEYADEPCETCSGGVTDGTGTVIVNDSDGDSVCDDDEIDGCTEEPACNYDSGSTENDGSCTYVDGICETCEGGIIVDNDSDDDDVCDDVDLGCTDPLSANYDIGATGTDGSCYPYISNEILDVYISEDDPDYTINLSNHFFDPDGQTLTYQVTAIYNFDNDASINTSIDGNILTISIDSDYFESDFGQISVVANDTDFQSSGGDTFQLNIAPVNDPPVITFVNGSDFTGSDLSYNHTIDVDDGTLLTLLIYANDDIDGSEQSAITPSVQSATGINAGSISLEPLMSNQWKAEYELVGTEPSQFSFIIALSNDTDADVELDITINVEDNAPPVIELIPDQTMDEDGSHVIDFNVTSTGDIITFNRIITSVSNGNTGNISTTLSGNLNDGYNLTLNPIENWNGVFNVRLEVVNDNSNSDTEIFSVIVNAQDDAPSLDMLTITVNEDNQGGGPFEHFLYLYDVDTDPDLNHVNDIDTYNSLSFDVSLDSNDNISSSGQGTQILPHPTSGENSLGFSYHFENKNENWNGTETFTATFNDEIFSGLEKEFDVRVAKTNDYPEIAVIGDQNMDEEGTLTVSVSATDIDSDTDLNKDQTAFNLAELIFTCTSDAGNDIGCSSSNTDASGQATLTITPITNFNKTNEITVLVSDEGPLTDDTTFVLSIDKENDAPELVVGDQTQAENSNFVYALNATDVDSDTSLNEPPEYDTTNFIYSIISVTEDGVASTHTASSINVLTNELTIVPDDNFNGTVLVEIQVDDDDATTPGALNYIETFNLTFEKENDDPVIEELRDSDGVVQEDFTMDEDSTLDIIVEASDIDSDATLNFDLPAFNLDDLVFSCSGYQVTCISTSDAGGIGNLEITPNADYNITTLITVEVDDQAGGIVTTNFNLFINQVPDSPILKITDSTIEIEEDDISPSPQFFYIYDVDADNNLNEIPIAYDPGSYSFELSPDPNLDYTSIPPIPALTDIDGVGSNVDVYMYPYYFSNITEHWNGPSTITAIFSDGVTTDQEDFTVTITKTNDLPVIEELRDSDGVVQEDFTMDEDSTLDIIVEASDIDSDATLNFDLPAFNLDDLVFSCSGNQVTCISTSDAGGIANLEITPDADYNITTNIIVEVDDQAGGIVTTDFDLTINPKNDAPILYNNSTDLDEVLDDDETNEEVPFTYTIYAEDIDSDDNLNDEDYIYDIDDLSYSIILYDEFDNPAEPTYATHTLDGDLLTITPVLNYFGIIKVEITVEDDDVTDPGSLSDVESFILTVVNQNDQPIITAIPDVEINEDLGIDIDPNNLDSIIIEVEAVDPDDDSLTYSAIANHFDISVDDNVITFIPEEHWHNDPGDINDKITVEVNVDDGIAENPASINFDIRINSVNDAPIVDNEIEIIIDEGSSPTEIVLDICQAADCVVIDNNFYNEESETFIYTVDLDDFAIPASFDNNETVTVSPSTNFVGSSTFTYFANDGEGFNSDSNLGTYIVTVENVNDAPELEDITDKTMDEDTKIQDIIDNNLEIPLFASDLDPGDDFLTFSASFEPLDKVETHTINQLTNSTAELLVEPIDDFNGIIEVTITVTDGEPFAVDDAGLQIDSEDTVTFNLLIEQVDDPPELSNIVDITMEEDQAGGVTSAIYYYDIDTDEELNLHELHVYSTTVVYSLANTLEPDEYISFGLVDADVENENYVINYNYVPTANYNGIEEFIFNASDGINILDPYSFNVIVTPVNDPPVINPIDDQVVDEDEEFDGDEEGHFMYQALSATDVDNDPLLNTHPTSQPQEFIFTAVISGEAESYIRPSSYDGCDNTEDADNPCIEVVPTNDYNGQLQISATVSDGTPDETCCSSESFNLFVFSVNDSPVMNPIASQQVEEDDVFSIPLSAEDIDANTSVNFDIMDGVCTICTDNIYDYAEFTYSITLYDDYGAGIVSTNATSNVNEITDDLTITPIDDFTGDIVVEVFATDNDTTQDGSLDSEPITFILTVNNKNDAPVIYPINEQFFDEDEFDIVEIDFTASDLDYDELFFSVEFESNGITDTDPFFIDGVSFDYNWDPDVFITEAALLLDIYENYNHDIIVTITVYDNLSIAYNHDGIEVPSEDSESFTITITPVNDAPHCYGISMSGHNNIQFKEDGRMFEGDPQQDDMGNIVVGTEITNATNTIQVDLLNYESSEGYSFIVLDIDSNELINKNAYDLNSLTFYVDTQPTKTLDGIPTQIGSIEFINNSSTMDWTPMANFNGWLDFLYYVQDEEYLSTPKTIAFYIGSVNDPVEPFELVSAIQDYAENAGVVSPYDDDYYIKFPNYEIDNVPLFIDDIDSSNVIEYYNYLDGNPYNEGTVTFKWERSSDVDTDQPINHSNEYLRYRLELIDELNEKVYIIKNQIRDAYIGPWDYTYCDDVNDIDYCSLTLTLNEGPYDTYNLNDRLNYDDVTINTENLIIDGTVEYKWRVSAYDWAGVTGYEQLVFPRFLSSEPYINTLTKSSIDDYYVDFTQPGFDYSFILNNIYNNYFDLYVQADETVEFNDSLYFAYIDTTIIEEESDGIISQIIEIENTYLNADIFSVYDKFNAYGLINTYFAGQDVSGNINIDKKEFTFNTIPYNSVNHYNSPSGLMRVIISNNSNSTNSNILLHEENNFNHEDIISQTVLINSNINIDESEIKIEFDRENIENIHHSHFNNIHIARVYDNHVELIPTYNDGNTIYAYLEDLGSFALILNEFSTYEVPYETKIVSSYPNPFNPTVTIDYTLEKDSFVEINVFNILGQKITQLHRGSQFRGDNKVVWNGKNLSGHKVSSGTYFVHIKNENNFLIEKVTLVK